MGKNIAYHCTHCGRDFEAEERDIVECPGCYWSTSVHRRDDVSAAASSEAPKPESGPKISLRIPSALLKTLTLLAAAFVLIWLLVLTLPRLQSVLSQRASAKSKPAAENVPESGSRKPAVQAPGGSASAPAAQPLSPEDQQVLERRVTLDPAREPDAAEKAVLDQSVPFRTGLNEQLPSPAWTLENYKQMLDEQQRFYKITFARSYRNKLEDLFKTAYLPAQEAFMAGDLLKARDLWVQSLAFPLYSTDIRKHRGVALTMLRPLITDTLSKIGALNEMAVSQNLRGQEQAISQAYQDFRDKLARKAWKEALRAADDLNSRINTLEQAAAQEVTAPPYAPSASAIDGDIQATLADILTPSHPAITDLQPMREDIARKRQVALGYLPESSAEQTALYEQALEKIAARDWSGARELLNKIYFPAALVQDARAKMSVLDKLESSSLESGGGSR